jgi:hypothetical protein
MQKGELSSGNASDRFASDCRLLMGCWIGQA